MNNSAQILGFSLACFIAMADVPEKDDIVTPPTLEQALSNTPLSSTNIVDSVDGSDCDCLAQRDTAIQEEFGAGSQEAEDFRLHVKFTCNATGYFSDKYTYCSDPQYKVIK